MRENYEVVIGLEVHAELSTKTKIFCSCTNQFGGEVNTQCCPICLGMPGTLPVLNKEVVSYGVKAGHALNCTVYPVSGQDRKNYFYPDLPKAYQISQHENPICKNGYIDVLWEGGTKRFGITRIHIEEDAGKLLHGDSFTGSLVDFNRCGVPLIEIVSEPDMRSSQEAKAYLENIRLILMDLDICDGKMEEGSIRCDVNVSVRKKGSTVFGTRVEMKNVNTIGGMVRAIEYESNRQIEILEKGGEIYQETRKWDDSKGENILLRSKENAQDYRFFREPDLQDLVIEESLIKELKNKIQELPNQKMIRYVQELKMSQKESEQLVFQPDKAIFFESVKKSKYKASTKTIVNWVLGDISRVANEQGKSIFALNITPEEIGEIIQLIEENQISNAAGKEIFETLIAQGGTVAQIIKDKNLGQISDSSVLEEIVEKVLEENESAVVDYKNGKTNILGFLVGQCMKRSKGQGNPAIMKELVINKIEKS